jgi:hypothetical protein
MYVLFLFLVVCQSDLMMTDCTMRNPRQNTILVPWLGYNIMIHFGKWTIFNPLEAKDNLWPKQMLIHTGDSGDQSAHCRQYSRHKGAQNGECEEGEIHVTGPL